MDIPSIHGWKADIHRRQDPWVACITRGTPSRNIRELVNEGQPATWEWIYRLLTDLDVVLNKEILASHMEVEKQFSHPFRPCSCIFMYLNLVYREPKDAKQ